MDVRRVCVCVCVCLPSSVEVEDEGLGGRLPLPTFRRSLPPAELDALPTAVVAPAAASRLPQEPSLRDAVGSGGCVWNSGVVATVTEALSLRSLFISNTSSKPNTTHETNKKESEVCKCRCQYRIFIQHRVMQHL